MSESCFLYHGPGARSAAVLFGSANGRLIAQPIGDDGLKVDDARGISQLLASVPTSEQLGVVVVGPMDEANNKASDALLKLVEENKNEYMVLVLWANDLGAVSPTIKSRCIERWSAGGDEKDDDALISAAFLIVDAVVRNDYLAIVDTIRPFDKREHQMVAAIAEVLSAELTRPDYQSIWTRLRPVITQPNPFLSEVIVALVGA